MVSKAKAGAHECIPYKDMTAERLAEGIKQCLTDEARENVKKIADSIAKEGDGALNAVRSFHRSLPLHGKGSMRCDLLDNQTAAWKIKSTNVKLSALAAEILVEKKKLKWSELRLIRHYEWNDFGGPGEPVTGVWGSLMTSMADAATGVGGVPMEMGKSLRKREKIREKKRKIEKRSEHKRTMLAKANAESSNNNSRKAELANDAFGKDGQQENRPPTSRQESTLSKISEPDEPLAEELGHEAAFGFRKTGGAIARLPMNLTLALTQGFHNAPRLYGDETVRRPPRVTGVHSGLRAGRDELLYGVMDGVTGIVTQPYRGARDGGVVGAFRGVGFGIGGFVLKDVAALIGPFAYSMKGLNAEYMKRYQPTNYLRRARIAQGQAELKDLEIKSRVLRIEENDKGEDKREMRRDQVEHQVNLRWQALQQTITEEKKHYKSGLVATLMGQGESKEGQRVGRKSTEAAARVPPTAQADKPRLSGSKEQKVKGAGNDKKFVNGQGRGPAMNRSITAPITTSEQIEHGDRSALEVPPSLSQSHHDDEQTPQENDTHSLDEPFLHELREEPVLKPSDSVQHGDRVTRESNERSGYFERPSLDASSEDTRVEKEPTNWTAVGQKVEGLEDRSRPLELHV